MKPLDRRVDELERDVKQLLREAARKPAREANPLAPEHGRWIGITAAEDNGDGTIDVTVHLYSLGDAEWQETALVIPDVRPFDEETTIPLSAKVLVIRYENCWVLIPLDKGGGGLYFAVEQTTGSPSRSSPEVDSDEGYILDPHDNVAELSSPPWADMLIHGPPDATGTMGSPVSGRVLNYTPFGYYNGTGHHLEVIKTGDVYIVHKPLLSNRQPFGSFDFELSLSSYTTPSGNYDPTSVLGPTGHSVWGYETPTGTPYYLKYLPLGIVRFRVYGYITWSGSETYTFQVPMLYLDQIDISTMQGTSNQNIGQTGSPSTQFHRRASHVNSRSFSGYVTVDRSSLSDPDAILVEFTNLPTLSASGDLDITAQLTFDPIW